MDDSGEAKVELFLKKFNIYAIPNSLLKLDKFDPKKSKQDDAFTIPLYFSKCEKIENFMKKVQRVLSTHLYMTLKDKSQIVSAVKLWKSCYEETEASKKIRELDKKFTNYTSVEIEGEEISSDPSKLLYELNYEDTDILIIEVPK